MTEFSFVPEKVGPRVKFRWTESVVEESVEGSCKGLDEKEVTLVFRFVVYVRRVLFQQDRERGGEKDVYI